MSSKPSLSAPVTWPTRARQVRYYRQADQLWQEISQAEICPPELLLAVHTRKLSKDAEVIEKLSYANFIGVTLPGQKLGFESFGAMPVLINPGFLVFPHVHHKPGGTLKRIGESTVRLPENQIVGRFEGSPNLPIHFFLSTE